MARRSGSRSSRSERRTERQRAERARQHGLPEAQQPASRARADEPAPRALDGEGGAAPVTRRSPAIPTWTKLLVAAAVILASVYWLGKKRDQALTGSDSAAASASAVASALPASSALVPPSVSPMPAPSPLAPPGAPSASR